jgi:integrase
MMREGVELAKRAMPVKTADRVLQDWIRDWLLDHVEGTVRPRTYDLYRSRLQHVVEHMGEQRMSRIGAPDVRRMYRALAEEDLAPATVAAIHRIFALCMRRAVEERIISSSPCSTIKVSPGEPEERRTLTVDEISRLIAAESDPMWRALWTLMATTGLRVGEAMALAWPNVDLSAGELRVIHTIVRLPGGGWVLGPPKTKASKRVIYMGNKTVSALLNWRADQDANKLHSIERFVFTAKAGKPLHGTTVNSRLQKALLTAGLPRMRVHDLRHTAATTLLARGETPKVVSEMLGHSSVSITLDLYGHVTPRMHREAQNRLDAML